MTGSRSSRLTACPAGRGSPFRGATPLCGSTPHSSGSEARSKRRDHRSAVSARSETCTSRSYDRSRWWSGSLTAPPSLRRPCHVLPGPYVWPLTIGRCNFLVPLRPGRVVPLAECGAASSGGRASSIQESVPGVESGFGFEPRRRSSLVELAFHLLFPLPQPLESLVGVRRRLRRRNNQVVSLLPTAAESNRGRR